MLPVILQLIGYFFLANRIVRKLWPEVSSEYGGDAPVVHADDAAEQVFRQLVPVFPANVLPAYIRNLLGVKHRSIHVEDKYFRYMHRHSPFFYAMYTII